MKVIDDNTKELFWWNRNYFFIGTILIVITNITLFGAAGNVWEHSIGKNESDWGAILNFDNLIRQFLNSFSHSNWQHVLLNMLCFFVVGLYLERKKGTIELLLLVAAMAFFTSTAVGANHLRVHWHGFSGVNFGFYAYVIVDYFFMLRKETRNDFDLISGAIIIALIYFAMCFNGGTSTVSFTWYPYDLMYNKGHYSSFCAGAIFGITTQIVKIISRKETKQLKNTTE